MVYQHNGILLGNKKEWSTVHYMDEPWKHYADWKKPDTKDNILQSHDSIYMRLPRIGKPTERESRVVVS